MRIIDAIEIRHFRSFWGSQRQYAAEIYDLSDINIFSGSNDSGKSNILRALNVFFNDRIAHDTPFDFDRDLFVGKADKVQKIIEITISFDLSNTKSYAILPNKKFKISKFYDRDGFRNYTYEFYLKDKLIRIDSRAERNKHIKELFLEQGISNVAAEQKERSYRQIFTAFLNSISFEYVPAIRDKKFFSQLFGRMISQIKESEDKKLRELQKEKNEINRWERSTKNASKKQDLINRHPYLKTKRSRDRRLKEIKEVETREGKLSAAIKNLEQQINQYSFGLITSIEFLPTEFKISKDLRDFFEDFDVGTGDQKTISLSLRGDGVQARLIPRILDFLSSISLQNRYFLWGFEEPENSAEYKNQQLLASELKEKFSKTKQIFLTTHSEEFLYLYDGAEVIKEDRIAKLYHVQKRMGAARQEYSQVYSFDVNANEFEFAEQRYKLDEDLGQSYLRAKYAKSIKGDQDRLLAKLQTMENERKELEQLIHLSHKPHLFVEDTYTQIYKIAWLKLNQKDHSEHNFEQVFEQECPFAIFSAGGAPELNKFLVTANIQYLKDRKILGLFDFDNTGVEKFKTTRNRTYWNVPIEGDKHTGHYKKRLDHPCFYAMLIPIPERLKDLADLDFSSNVVEIENLLPTTFLRNNNFVDEARATGNTTYLKIRTTKKSKIWGNLFELSAKDFEDFRPLFDKASHLLLSR